MIQVDSQQLNGGVTGGEGICCFRSHDWSVSKRLCSSPPLHAALSASALGLSASSSCSLGLRL
eukprot:3648253-Rhodomonas_salina.1